MVKHIFPLINSFICTSFLLCCSTVKNSVPQVEYSNAIILKEYYDGFWSHFQGGDKTHPNSKWGQFIVLNPCWFSDSDDNQLDDNRRFRLRSTYYEHGYLSEFEDMGIWYVENDTLFLEPKYRMDAYITYVGDHYRTTKTSVKDVEALHTGLKRKFVFDGKYIKEVSSLQTQKFVHDNSPYYNSSYYVFRYVVIQNETLFRKYFSREEMNNH